MIPRAARVSSWGGGERGTGDFPGGIRWRTSRRAAIQVRSVVVGASTRNAEAILMPFRKAIRESHSRLDVSPTVPRKHPELMRMNPSSVSKVASHQPDLFPLEGAPQGLLFEPEIMTAVEEAVFLDIIKALPFGAFRLHGVHAKRRIVRY